MPVKTLPLPNFVAAGKNCVIKMEWACHLLCKRPGSCHRASKTHSRGKIFKVSIVHAAEPPLWTESQMPVKTLPLPNFIAAGKNCVIKMEWACHLLCKRPGSCHRASKTHSRGKISKVSIVHASVIYQIPWNRWISDPFRDNFTLWTSKVRQICFFSLTTISQK